jgi:Cytochrome c7 and related cytochrome c
VTANWTTVSFDHSQAQGTCLSCHDGAHPPALGKNAAPAPGHIPSSNVCEDCHTTIAWKPAQFDHASVAGTACFTCHNGTRAEGKNVGHLSTTNTCDDCHTSAGWKPARFDHGSATNVANCFACHDGAHPPALGKSSAPNHPQSSNDCQACHTNFTSWTAVTFSHSDPVVAATACFSCHDGAHAPALGKPQNHLKTTNDCAVCHTTTNWTTVNFDHSQAQGTCFSCHDGNHAPALGKSPNHFNTSNACDSCHVTTNWTTVAFDHSQANGSCVSCHDGAHAPARGKDQGHFITTQPCESCHVTTSWTTILPYTHLSPAYENHGGNVSLCTDCHKQNNEKIAFQRPDLAPDCASCHANDFKLDPHKKYESPTTKFYTVDELRDCTGACHIYSNQTLTTIKTRRTGPEHRATAGSF